MAPKAAMAKSSSIKKVVKNLQFAKASAQASAKAAAKAKPENRTKGPAKGKKYVKLSAKALKSAGKKGGEMTLAEKVQNLMDKDCLIGQFIVRDTSCC